MRVHAPAARHHGQARRPGAAPHSAGGAMPHHQVPRLGIRGGVSVPALILPESRSVANALELLTTIGALDRNEDFTPLGHHLAALPVDPRVGKMIITAAALGCLSPALTIAAGMAYKDPFVLHIDKKQVADHVRRQLAGGTCSDHIALVRAFEGWERARREGGAGRGRTRVLLVPLPSAQHTGADVRDAAAVRVAPGGHRLHPLLRRRQPSPRLRLHRQRVGAAQQTRG
mmetsp:Transcript_6160/g.15693  ORF Transcript_6160/g.15693 Transcript_6160/m.15693 type:complete len:229 (-) Transcript_6160:346-1032(-)